MLNDVLLQCVAQVFLISKTIFFYTIRKRNVFAQNTFLQSSEVKMKFRKRALLPKMA